MSTSSSTDGSTGVTVSAPVSTILPGSVYDLPPINSAYRLDGTNYLKWSQLVRMYLKGRGKLSHLLGTGPATDDPKFEAWDNADSLIMSWLVNSMTPEIGDTCIFLTSAKAIWDAMEQTYSKVRDGARIYELRTKIHRVRQGNMSITEYSNYLKGLWQELDHYQCIPIKASEEVKAFKIFMEKQRVYDFLAGLNPEYDAVRVQILGKEETLLNGAISIVLAEEGRRGVMMESQPTESSALMTKANVPRSEGTASTKANVPRPEGTASTKSSLWCTYCKKPRHTKDNC